ncbi:MAG: xanthine dehydrogenase family protein molybdopterin-binding subunit, partial [Sphingobium sp.]
YRAETRHHVQLAANDKGRLTAMVHEGWEVASRPSPYTVAGTDATARMYACPNISTRVNVVQADRNTPGFMRCPSEVPYMFALESAMDELAHELKIDPIELRRRNDTQTDPIDGRPYSSRSLMQCYDRGAELFGWKARDATPRSHRDGDWLVGWGCSTACYPANRGGSAARVSLDSSGKAKAQVAFHEIGNGAYTVVAQTAAAALGIPIRDVSVELGDTLLPVGNIAAGSNGTATTCNAVSNACAEILQKLNRGERESLRDAVDRVGGLVEATGNFVDPNLAPGALARLQRGIPAIASGVSAKGHIMFSFGAQFIEVRVHRLTGEVRVPRVAGVFAAGRIINRRTAHSQLTGGLIWGIGSALLEQTIVDPHSARYLNDNFADYLVAVNADIGDMQVEMIEEQDPFVNPMGIKGVGELGCSGTNAAVANAVFHATGKRIRDLPVRAHLLI